ncbi:NAD(P)/FAD-dependent oxidoreductase [Paenibacillus sp. MSJ-34]|uniref:NAD(P)/FAD-dependent oxidoreductase n=1 Tax=Paenibacillus sp. MSJ-34 TaxID=2841529 RepID=UPI001C0F7A3C|nr:NAD(P)/FAD-dependent oxidoreductase [Paenibacillus sp. MSJ-34]MBU5442983.1 NAD(P)/FAD-dependent oxidoreductase [Paenibacillus sp. MSJ-34]
MGQRYDIAILGGGVAGASMAAALASRGWRTLLIERHVFPRHKVCGEFLSPESARSLVSLGLDAPVESLRPAVMNRVKLIAPGECELDIPLPAPAFGVSRFALDHKLHQVAREHGAEVRTGTTVVSVSPDERGFRISARNRDERYELDARAAIGAWGRNPRHGLTTKARHMPRNSYIGVKAHYESVSEEAGAAVELYFYAGGYAGVAPIGEGRINVAALMTQRAFDEAGRTVSGALGHIAVLNRAFRHRLAGAVSVEGTETAVAQVEASRKPVAWDQYAHIGDAAAVVPPLCGDGMAMALRSVELCSPLADGYLRGQLSLSAWRREYARLLKREFTGPMRWGRWIQSVMGNRAAASLAVRLGLLVPGAAARIVQATRLSMRE